MARRHWASVILWRYEKSLFDLSCYRFALLFWLWVIADYQYGFDFWQSNWTSGMDGHSGADGTNDTWRFL